MNTTYLSDRVYGMALVGQNILQLVCKEIAYDCKYQFLLWTSYFWLFVQAVCTISVIRTQNTKSVLFGFPAKWLILTAVMLAPMFYPGVYFTINSMNSTILNNIIIRDLSIKAIV